MDSESNTERYIESIRGGSDPTHPVSVELLAAIMLRYTLAAVMCAHPLRGSVPEARDCALNRPLHSRDSSLNRDYAPI